MMRHNDKAWDVRRIAVFAYDEANSLDVVGPLQVFSSASRFMRLFPDELSKNPRLEYAVEIAASRAGPVTLSPGFDVVARRGMGPFEDGLDTLLVAGGDGHDAAARDARVLDWLRGMVPQVRRLGSVCSGAFILAAAGLLDGRRATTHWRQCAELAAAYPAIRVEPDALHVRDGDIYTSAGVTAGMDLALALVEEDCGREVALATAREMVLFLKRPGGQSQFSTHLQAQAADKTAIRALQDWILQNLDGDLSVDRLAARVAMSPRNFARVFARETGTTPAKFVERARIDAARRALEDSAAPMATVAARCGFGHPETMRRVFQRHLSVAPQDYRQRFRRSGVAAAV